MGSVRAALAAENAALKAELAVARAKASEDMALIAAAPGMFDALRLAREQLAHNVPDDCWSTGPSTGDQFQDLVVCPGCAALAKIDAALAKALGEK